MNKRLIIILLCILIGVTFVSFLPALTCEFTNWDDDIYITDNPIVRVLSLENIKNFFTFYYARDYLDYHPLTIFSYAVEYHFFKLNPVAYHATNLIFHLMNTGLVFWLIILLCGNPSISFITALLFGIHPLHVESVAWVAERKDVLYSFFYLGALISYLHLKKKHEARYYVIALILFICSLLSKAMAITLPVVLILFDYFAGEKVRLRTILSKTPFFICSIISALIAFSVIPKRPDRLFTPVQNLLTACHGIMFYLKKLVLPINLSAVYPYPEQPASLPIAFWIAPFVVLAGCLGIYLSIKHTRKVLFGALFFIITIMPVLQIIPGAVIAADRYTYIPYIGIFYLAGEGYCRLARAYGQRIIGTILCVIMVILCVLTFQRCLVWKDSVSLWEDILKSYPGFSVAYSHRASAHYARGNYDKAIADYTFAIALSPHHADIYNNRGIAYYTKGNYEKALIDYNTALQLDPNSAEAYNNRGYALLQMKSFDKAAADFSRAIALNPKYVHAYNNRGNAYQALGQFELAIADYTKTLSLDPDYADAYGNRGNAYCALGKFQEGIADFTRVLNYNPDNPRINNNRGYAYYLIKEYERALADFSRAISTNPQDALAYNNRGNIFSSLGRFEQAIADYTAAIHVNPGYPNPYGNRAFAYYKAGKYPEARADVSAAQSLGFQIDPQFLEELRRVSEQ
jgi:tetratricopeptide (TPR) repeat protein